MKLLLKVKYSLNSVPSTVYSTLLFLLLCSCFGFAIWKLPQRQAAQIKQRIENIEPSKKVSSRELFELENTIRENVLDVIKTIAGLGFILTVYFTWKNLKIAEKNRELAEDKQATERFSTAVRLLADTDKLEARIGGIYILERITKDSPEDHASVMELLSSFVRNNAPPKPDWAKEKGSVERPKYCPADIQAALTVIGRRDIRNDEDFRLNLGGANLCGAELNSFNFSNAYLAEVTFEDSRLISANLQGAYLKYVDLRGANLTHANCKGAHFSCIIIDGTTDILFTDFSGASLSNADIDDIGRAQNRESAIFDDRVKQVLAEKDELTKETLDE